MDKECCEIRDEIATSASSCGTQKGGGFDVRVSCLKFVSVVEDDCSAGGGNDAKVTDIVTQDGVLPPAPLFFKISTKDKTVEHIWGLVFDPETGTTTFEETLNFSVEIKDRAFYCVIKTFISQEVVFLFKEKGTNRWYIVGRKGGINFTEIRGGTGTTEFTPSTFVATGDDVDDIFLEVFDTSVALTDVLVDSVTA